MANADPCRDVKDLVDRILDEMSMVESFASRSDPKGDIRSVLATLRKGRPVEPADAAAVDPAIVYAWRLQAAIAQAKMDCVEELVAYVDEQLGAPD